MKTFKLETIALIHSLLILGVTLTFFACQSNKSIRMTSETKIPEGAIITMDTNSQIPISIVNINAFIKELQDSSIILTRDNAEKIFKKFIKDNSSLLKIDPNNLKLVTSNSSDDTWYIKFQQNYHGVPIEGATVGIISQSTGLIKSYSSSYIPDININTEPTVSSDVVIQSAKKTYKDEQIESRISAKQIEKVILKFENKYRLVWKFIMETPERNPEIDQHFIYDAQTGELLKKYPVRFPGAKAFGTIRGQIYPELPTDQVTTVGMPFEIVRIHKFIWPSIHVTANIDGKWTKKVPWIWTFIGSNGYTSHYTLEGKYCHVTDNNDDEFTDDLSCTLNNSCDFTWNIADRDPISVYYHINRLHNYFANQIGFNWTNPWTGTNVFNARVNFNYDNAVAGDPLDFGNDNFARSSDVVYHECSHNVIFSQFDDWVGFPDAFDEGYAFDEGFADFFACAFTNEPELGEGCGIIRSLDNNNAYDGKNNYNQEGHNGGLIIAGAAWDIRQRFIDRYGVTAGAKKAEKLVFKALQSLSTMPEEYFFSDPNESNFLKSLYLASDNNGNLLDGIPNFEDIQLAFYNHNLLQAVLTPEVSFDVSTNTVGTLTGGDFYYTKGKFWANNFGQRGVIDLGDIGVTTLEDADIPSSGYSRFGVDAVLGHTYVSMAQSGEEGKYIVFKVAELKTDDSEVVIEYLYRSPLILKPFDICDVFPALCDLIYDCPLCDDFPIHIPGDTIIIRFSDIRQKVILPADKICQYVINCPGCSSAGLCQEYKFTFEGMINQINLLAYNSKGVIVARGSNLGKYIELNFKTTRNEKYFIVIQPSKELKIGNEVEVVLKIR